MATADPLRIALAQLDVCVGDIAGNERRIAGALDEARAAGAHLVLLPELAITGYPPEDLLLKAHFLRDARAAVERLAAHAPDIVALVGFPELADDAYNSLAVLAGGELRGIYRKVHLPNYGVFDEQRYFQVGPGGALLEVGEHTLGLTICEDIWRPGPPAADAALAGATLIVNLSASPYHAGKGAERERMIAQRARDTTAAVAFCNLVGGQDELVFDGHSLIVDHEGAVLARGAQFAQELVVADVDLDAALAPRLRSAAHRPAARRGRAELPTLARLPPADRGDAPSEPESGDARGTSDPSQPAAAEPLALRREQPIAPLLDGDAEVYAALTTGLRDYVDKNGFRRVVLGLSGGIDSALVAVLAVDALGAERVSVVIMPSPHSSPETQADARTLAANLRLESIELPIADVMAAYERALAEQFAAREPDTTEENIQARIRGNLLMALSNKFGWLVLTTGNKSEMSVGYSTLYGDLAGGLAVIKDVPKTLVYSLARHRNARDDGGAGGRLIPETIITRAPSAELRPDQRDEESLPPYDVLDEILAGYVEHDLGRDALVNRGLPAEEVERVIRLVDLAEYKRRQAPPGIKVTTRALGRDRRMPITNRYGG